MDWCNCEQTCNSQRGNAIPRLTPRKFSRLQKRRGELLLLVGFVNGDGAVGGAERDARAARAVCALHNSGVAAVRGFEAGGLEIIFNITLAGDSGNFEVRLRGKGDADAAGFVGDEDIVVRRARQRYLNIAALVGEVDSANDAVERDVFVRGGKLDTARNIGN